MKLSNQRTTVLKFNHKMKISTEKRNMVCLIVGFVNEIELEFVDEE
jgi:hypothetical protein